MQQAKAPHLALETGPKEMGAGLAVPKIQPAAVAAQPVPTEGQPTAMMERPAAMEERPTATEERPAAVSEERPAAMEERPAVVTLAGPRAPVSLMRRGQMRRGLPDYASAVCWALAQAESASCDQTQR